MIPEQFEALPEEAKHDITMLRFYEEQASNAGFHNIGDAITAAEIHRTSLHGVGDAMQKLESGIEHLKRIVKKEGSARDPRYCLYRRDRKLEP